MESIFRQSRDKIRFQNQSASLSGPIAWDPK